MQTVDKALCELYESVLTTGQVKQAARKGQISTISKFNHNITLDCSKQVLISSVKHVSFKNVFHELLWFLKGDTNIQYLTSNGCNIWNQDAYRYYKELFPTCDINMHTFLSRVKFGDSLLTSKYKPYTYGDLGSIYGHQWIKTNALARVINELIVNKDSRYLVIDSWDESNFFDKGVRSLDAALPCCHYSMQFYTRTNDCTGKVTLDLKVIQRSADVFLGVPYNLLSYQLLLIIVASITKYKVGCLHWSGGDCHIYENQISAVEDFINTYKNETLNTSAKLVVSNLKTVIRKYLKLDSITDNITRLHNINSLLSYIKYEDIELLDYAPFKTIKAPLSTGLKTD